MKTLIVLSFLFSVAAGAETSRFPFPPLDVLCQGSRCTEAMQQILTDYKNAPDFFPVDQLPAFASGACYHIEPGTNPLQTHYGMWLFDTKDGAPVYGGLFGFWYNSNPWQDWTIDQARERLKDSTPHPIDFLPTEARGLIQFPKANIYYWFRRDEATHTLYLLGYNEYFGTRTVVSRFCRFNY